MGINRKMEVKGWRNEEWRRRKKRKKKEGHNTIGIF
jgi:hypothetical protein